MNRTNLIQGVRLVAMVLAIAGIIYALEFMRGGIAVWFWVALLGVGFMGVLVTFRMTQRRVRAERRSAEKNRKRHGRRARK